MDDFWSVVGIAATVSSAFAAVVSTGLVLFFRYRDRPAASWLVEPLNFRANTDIRTLWSLTGRGDPSESITITNVGDGAAYRLQVRAQGCIAMMFLADSDDLRGYRTPSTLARRNSTESFGIFIWHDDVRLRDKSTVELTWIEMPTRHKKKRSESIPITATLRALEQSFNETFNKDANDNPAS